ncbi:SMP-30/gluconolactonase/LRE family protein [Pararhodonellum marinum]|uniref:SMP-30/gluconolactonase/LRE family protein n=1 Tax=Pararhodonellum marinum TaxID=2755358 RepID=UPI00188E0614|nr:SMP-30/gluconolactonase/LRE family protein [Pararhodonellum marinum]
MQRILPYFLVLTLFYQACQPAGPQIKQDAHIEMFDDKVLSLIDPDTKPEIISSGHEWTEGPLWLEESNTLLFADIPNNAIYQVRDGVSSLYLKPSGYTGKTPRGGEVGANGLLLDPEGRLVMCQHGDRRMARMESALDDPQAEFTTLVDSYQGKRLNSPNDAVYDKAGNLYFTDPPYGLELNMNDPAKELDFQGIYCLKTDGELLFLDTMSRPNGIAFSPDQSSLLVANSDPKAALWYRYDVLAPGVLDNRTLFYDATSFVGKAGYAGLPDGMKVHSAGFLFATGPGGVWVFDMNAKPVARIATGEATSNCAFSADEKWLFITADSEVLRMRLK